MAALDGAILGGKLLTQSNLKAGFFNPPLGVVNNHALPVYLAVGICLATVIPLRATKRWLTLLTRVGFVVIVVSIVGYGWSMQHYGRPIDIPARDISDFVIAGTQRTPFATENFKNVDDITMLEQRGWDEDSLRLYWSQHSLNRSRDIVMFAFLGSLISFDFIVASTAIGYCRVGARRKRPVVETQSQSAAKPRASRH